MFEFRAIGARADEARPVMEEIVDKVLDRNESAFLSRGATTGRYWDPLKASTIRIKSNFPSLRMSPEDPLIRRGRLMDSLTKRDAANQTLDVDDDGFFLATTLEFAEFHVTGTSRMPARPPMTIPAKHAHEYIGMINDFVFGEGDYGR